MSVLDTLKDVHRVFLTCNAPADNEFNNCF